MANPLPREKDKKKDKKKRGKRVGNHTECAGQSLCHFRGQENP
jgi:hypothetical protein